jgi:magnesium chelatase subunit I
VLATTTGKVEVETVGEDTPEERIVERLVTKAVFATFNRHASVDRLEPVLDAFDDGLVMETGERIASREYVRWMREVPGLSEAVEQLGTFDGTDGAQDPALVASAVEFLLEGLHLQRRLNKDRGPAGVTYRR